MLLADFKNTFLGFLLPLLKHLTRLQTFFLNYFSLRIGRGTKRQPHIECLTSICKALVRPRNNIKPNLESQHSGGKKTAAILRPPWATKQILGQSGDPISRPTKPDRAEGALASPLCIVQGRLSRRGRIAVESRSKVLFLALLVIPCPL